MPSHLKRSLRYTYIARVVFTNSLLLPSGKITFLRASKVAVPLRPLAHGVLQCLPRHPSNASLPNSLSKKQSDEHPMLGGQIHCPSKSCDSLSCVAGRGREEPALRTRLTKMYIHPHQSFNIAVRIHCCPRTQEVHKRLRVILSKYLRVTGNYPYPHFPLALHSKRPAHPRSIQRSLPLTDLPHSATNKGLYSSPVFLNLYETAAR